MNTPVFCKTDGAFLRAHGPLARQTGSVNAAVLVIQLEYWFRRKPQGFYKFLAPCAHPLYRPDDSWTEQTALSPDEFRTAFARVGVRYASRAQYRTACRSGQDPFQGRLYLAYTDRRTNVTYYERHHARAAEYFQALALDVEPPAPAAARGTPLPLSAETGLAHTLETGNSAPPFTNPTVQAPTPALVEKKKKRPARKISTREGVSVAQPGEKEKSNAETVPVWATQTENRPVIQPLSVPFAPEQKSHATLREVQTATEAFRQRGLNAETAQAEATRMVAWYAARNWHSHNGFRVTDITRAALHWQIRPPKRPKASPGAGFVRPNGDSATQAPTPKPPALPSTWQPELYARMKYLQQLDYLAHLERLGWQKVRPPEGTPAIIDRWFLPPA